MVDATNIGDEQNPIYSMIPLCALSFYNRLFFCLLSIIDYNVDHSLCKAVDLLLLEQECSGRGWKDGVMSVLIRWSACEPFRVLEVVAVHEIHDDNLDGVDCEEPTGTRVIAVSKGHHVVGDGRCLRPGQVSGFAHAQESVRVKLSGVGAPKVWVNANQLAGKSNVGSGGDVEAVFESVILSSKTVHGYCARGQ